MQSRIAYVVLQLALTLSLALLLAALHRRSKRDPVLWYWALYWFAQVPSYATVILYILPAAGEPVSIPETARIPLLLSLSFQPVAIAAAAICLRWGKPRARLVMGLWAGSLLIFLALRFATSFPTHASIVICRNVLNIVALVGFASEVARRLRSSFGLGNLVTLCFSVGFGIHQLLQALAQLEVGLYTRSAASTLVGSLLQLSMAFGVVLSVVEESVHVANEAREADRRFRVLMESVQLCGVILDMQARVTFMNDHFLRLTGWSREEVMGRDYFEVFSPPAQREAQRHLWTSSLSGDDTALHVESSIQTRDGALRTIQWTNTPLRGASRTPLGTASLGQDVTRQRMLEDQFRQAQKMESIGRLAGGVAHDFNNHLTVINGYCDLLLSRLSPADASHHAVSEVRKAGERAADLTRQLLAFSRRQVLDPKPVSMHEVVRGLESMLRRLLREEIDLVTELRHEAAIILADRGQMEQVLINLVVNARDAIDGPGRIIVEVDCLDSLPPGDPNYPGTSSGPYVMLAVTDTGHGMEQATISSIFEPFFTTKGADRGTGLGLSMVHGIVQQSGGWIQVSSELGTGTTFRIYLPRLADSLPAACSTTLAPSPEGGNESVLLVEDRREVRELTSTILKEAGYSVVEAPDGPTALEMLGNGIRAVDLLITDAVMPRMTGLELARRFRQLLPAARVLCISGYTTDPLTDPRLGDGGVAYLPKPFTPHQFLQKVRKTLDQKPGPSARVDR
jgi:two-component system cell cycle sensor histidine kinase/response regulator CckA